MSIVANRYLGRPFWVNREGLEMISKKVINYENIFDLKVDLAYYGVDNEEFLIRLMYANPGEIFSVGFKTGEKIVTAYGMKIRKE